MEPCLLNSDTGSGPLMDCENIFQGIFCAAEPALRTARLRAAELPTAATQPSPERGGQVVDLRWGISEPSHDQRVVEREPVTLGHLQAPVVDLLGQRHHLADGGDGFECLADFAHFHTELA